MANIINKFNDILKDKKIDFYNPPGSSTSEGVRKNFEKKADFDITTLLKFKSIFDKANDNNNPRNQLLYSLKPFLKDNKKEKLEKYIKVANILYVLNSLNENKGDDSKC